MTPVIKVADLAKGENSEIFHGHEHGAPVSFFLSHHRPSTGPSLHRHDYEETFIVEEGDVLFTLGDASGWRSSGVQRQCRGGLPTGSKQSASPWLELPSRKSIARTSLAYAPLYSSVHRRTTRPRARRGTRRGRSR